LHETAHEAAGVVTAAQGFAVVGDGLDGVDEVFASGSQLVVALVGREVFEFNVMGSGCALGFEGVEGGLHIVGLAQWLIADEVGGMRFPQRFLGRRSRRVG